MYDWIKSYGYTGYVIATKADKISKSQRIKQKNIIKKVLNVDDLSLIIDFSSSEKLNVEKVWELFENIINLK